MTTLLHSQVLYRSSVCLQWREKKDEILKNKVRAYTTRRRNDSYKLFEPTKITSLQYLVVIRINYGILRLFILIIFKRIYNVHTIKMIFMNEN